MEHFGLFPFLPFLSIFSSWLLLSSPPLPLPPPAAAAPAAPASPAAPPPLLLMVGMFVDAIKVRYNGRMEEILECLAKSKVDDVRVALVAVIWNLSASGSPFSCFHSYLSIYCSVYCFHFSIL